MHLKSVSELIYEGASKKHCSQRGIVSSCKSAVAVQICAQPNNASTIYLHLTLKRLLHPARQEGLPDFQTIRQRGPRLPSFGYDGSFQRKFAKIALR